MFTILVPIDFSKNADHALRFAMQLASHRPVKLVVVQIGEILIPTSTPHHVYLELYPQKLKEKTNELKSHVKKIMLGYELPNLHMEYDWMDAFIFLTAIESAVEKHRVKLIVMGTKGASGLTKILMGSNTVKVIESSKIPVLAIPENTELRIVKSVSYASDLQEIKNEMKVLVKFADHFNWDIRIFHIHPNYPEWVDTSKENLEIIMSEIKKTYPKQVFSIELVATEQENDIVKGIDSYVEDFKPDILVMFPSEITFLDRILRSSNTTEMAFHSTVPLLVIRQG